MNRLQVAWQVLKGMPVLYNQRIDGDVRLYPYALPITIQSLNINGRLFINGQEYTSTKDGKIVAK